MATTRTAILLAAMTGLFVGIGYLLGGATGSVIAFVIAAGMNFFAYWNSDRMVLRMYGAREVSAAEAPNFHAIVTDLAARANLPMPKVYIIEDDQPNAFATGRNPQNAAVAASTGLLQLLTPEEVAGVMAHELSHVRNRDTLTMTVTATLAGAIGMLANFAMFFNTGRDQNGNANPLGLIGGIVIMIVAPLAAALVQMAISRSREYEADRGGAEISGNPLALASALQKISNAARQVPNETAERNPATAHMFIINPLSGARMDNLFSTHPAVENRVAALEAMAGHTATPAYAAAPARAARAPWGGRRAGPWG